MCLVVFVQRLDDTLDALTNIASSKTPTVVPRHLPCEESKRGSKDTAVWISKSCNLAYCIGRPRHFNLDECCPYYGLSETTYNADAVGQNEVVYTKTTTNRQTSDSDDGLKYGRRRDTVATTSTSSHEENATEEESAASVEADSEIEDTINYGTSSESTKKPPSSNGPPKTGNTSLVTEVVVCQTTTIDKSRSSARHRIETLHSAASVAVFE